MAYVLQSLGWPDLVAVAVPFVSLVFAGFVLYASGRFFGHVKTFMLLTLMFGAIGSYGSVVTLAYFNARSEGFPPLWPLLLNAADATGGYFLFFFTALVLTIPLWEVALRYLAKVNVYEWHPRRGYRGPGLLKKLTIPLAFLPIALFGFWIYRSGWLALYLFGKSVPFEQYIEELTKGYALLVTDTDYPIRFSIFLGRIASLLGIVRDNWFDAFVVVSAIATLIMFVYLFLINHVWPAIKQIYARPDEEHLLPPLKYIRGNGDKGDDDI